MLLLDEWDQREGCGWGRRALKKRCGVSVKGNGKEAISRRGKEERKTNQKLSDALTIAGILQGACRVEGQSLKFKQTGKNTLKCTPS